MPAFLKLGDIDGEANSYYKVTFNDLKSPPKDGYNKVGYTKGGYTKVEWTYRSRSRLAAMGMSQEGIKALIDGDPVQDEKDKQIVAGLVQQALG